MNSQKTAEKRIKTGTLITIIVLAVIGILTASFFASDAYGRLRYPLRYEDSIRLNADRFGLDPYHVAAVIRTESDFDPQAVSRAGAMGLMQIMPETGDWIAGKLGVADFTPEMLLEPERNIEFGCWYLQFLNERFTADQNLVSAAYNAGHNKVSSWLEDESISEDGEHLHAIPYKETRDYVQRIAAAYEQYRRLYPNAFQI